MCVGSRGGAGIEDVGFSTKVNIWLESRSQPCSSEMDFFQELEVIHC